MKKEKLNLSFSSYKLYISIEKLMTEEKLYRNSTLSRKELEIRLGTNKNKVIHAIRQETGLTFREYINKFRLKDATELLSQDREETIEVIAEQCGFGCTRSFYRHFYKVYAYSPQIYRTEMNYLKMKNKPI